MTAKKTARPAAAAKFDSATSLAGINKNIGLLRKNSLAFRDLLQTTIVMIARHASATGDCTAMARLMNDGLSNWYRRGPICDYIRDFTPIVVTFKAGVAVAKFEEADQRKPFNIDGLVATPFWEHKSLAKDNELPLEIDEVDTTVVKLADRLAKKLKDGEIAPSAVAHTELLIAELRGSVQKARAADRAPKAKAPKAKAPKAPAQDAVAAMQAAAAA